MGQGDSARDFGTSESMKNAGILDVFPIFHTARLGQKIRRSPQSSLCGVALNKTDIAVLVMDAAEGLQDCDGQLPDLFRAWEISYLIVYNKSDLLEAIPAAGEHEIDVSALRSEGIHELKGRIARLNQARSNKRIIGDLLPMRCGSGRADHQLRHADRLYERNSGTEP